MADDVEGIKVKSSAIKETRPAKARLYVARERVRHVNAYVLSETEMVGLSVLNPIGAAFFGVGVNLFCSWAQMPQGTDSRHLVGLASAALLLAGGVIVLTTWVFFIRVWFQSKAAP